MKTFTDPLEYWLKSPVTMDEFQKTVAGFAAAWASRYPDILGEVTIQEVKEGRGYRLLCAGRAEVDVIRQADEAWEEKMQVN